MKITLSKNYLEHCTESNLKRIGKKLKEVQKDIRNSRPKKFFLSKEYIIEEDVFDFLMEQNKNVLELIKEEKQKAWKYFNNEQNTIDAGWYDRKPQLQKLEKWADLAYPNTNVDNFDLMFETEVYNKELQRRKG